MKQLAISNIKINANWKRNHCYGILGEISWRKDKKKVHLKVQGCTRINLVDSGSH